MSCIIKSCLRFFLTVQQPIYNPYDNRKCPTPTTMPSALLYRIFFIPTKHNIHNNLECGEDKLAQRNYASVEITLNKKKCKGGNIFSILIKKAGCVVRSR